MATAKGLPSSATDASPAGAEATEPQATAPQPRGAGSSAGRLPTEGELASLVGISQAAETASKVRQAALVRLAKAAMSPALGHVWDRLAPRAAAAVLVAAGLGMQDELDGKGATAAAALAAVRRLVRHQRAPLVASGCTSDLLIGVLRLVRHAGRRRELLHGVVRTADEVSGAMAADDALTCCLTVLSGSVDAALGSTAAPPDAAEVQVVCSALKVVGALVPRLSDETLVHQLGGGEDLADDVVLAVVARCMSATEREVRKNATVLLSACLERMGPASFAAHIDPVLTRSQRSLVRIFHEKQKAKG